MDQTYNSIDYTISDIAYIKNSLPKFIHKTKFPKPHTPSTCDDYNTVYINLLEPDTNINTLESYITWATSIMPEVSLNDLVNIWFYIKNINNKLEQQSILTQYETDNKSINYRNIFIERSIEIFKKNYNIKFNKRDVFRQLNPIETSDHIITSSTKKFTLNSKYTLNEVFNSIELTNNFPICKYYTYLKLHSTIDNDNVLNTELTSNIYNYKSDNTDQIILFYLVNSSKPELTKSYIPIRIFKHLNHENIHIHFNIDQKSWKTLEQEFNNMFVNIDIGPSSESFKQGYIFIKDSYYNYSLMSHICLMKSDNFVIKNEKSSTSMAKFKMTYNTNIDITIKNRNIVGNEKFSILKQYPNNTKYIEIFFKNVLHDGDVCNIKKYIGKLFNMYTNNKIQLTQLYTSVIKDFSEKEDISFEKEVKSKELSQFVMQNMKALPKPNYTYSRDCQKTKSVNKQPSFTSSPPELQDYMGEGGKFKEYFKEDENDRLYMKWPKDYEEDVYFYCDSDLNKEFNIVSINSNQVPCCFKRFSKPKNEAYFLKSSSENVKELTQTIKENLYSNYNIKISDSLNYKSLSSYINTNVNSEVKNMDIQSIILDLSATSIEYITLSLEYTNKMNIITFNEQGLLISPKSHSHIHNLYYKTDYDNSIVLIRKGKSYAQINIDDDTIFRILKQRNNTYILDKNIRPFIMPNLNMIKSQYVDVYGKCRILKLILSENKYLYCQTLLPPLPIKLKKLKDVDTLIKQSDIDDVYKFMNKYKGNVSNFGQYIQNNRCVEVKFNFNMYTFAFVVNTEEIENVVKYERKSIIYSNTSNFSRFSEMKDKSMKLKEKVINSKKSIRRIVEKHVTDDVDVIIRKLEYFKNIFIERKVKSKSYVENLFNISDYISFPNQRIMYISSNIIPRKYLLEIQTIQEGVTNIFNEPYVVFFNNDVYLAQDSNNLQNAFYITTNWYVNKFNYKYFDKYVDIPDSYVIYEYDGSVNKKVGEGMHKLVLVQKGEMYKFIALLPLNEYNKLDNVETTIVSK